MTLDWVLALAGAAASSVVVMATLWHGRLALPRARITATAIGWAALVLALVLFDRSVPQLVNSYLWQIIIKVGIYITLAVSLNIINGIAGQFSMGHAGFMAVGAYVAAYLTLTLGASATGWVRWLPWNGPWSAFAGSSVLQSLPWGVGGGVVFLCALLAGGLAASLAGYLVGIPSLRLRGDYLAIVTLGFGEIIRNLIANVNVIGASRGLPGVPHYSNLLWVYLFAAIAIFVSYRLLASGPGRSMLAVREDEVAAAAMGIDTTRVKIQAFAIGTFFAGVAGGLLGHHFEYLHPDYFKFDKSFEVIIMVVLGGMGSVSGATVAAILIALAPEVLRYAKDLLGNVTEPAVLYATAPFILFAILFLGLFLADTVRLVVRASMRLTSVVRVRSRQGISSADLARLRRGRGRRLVSLIAEAVSLAPRFVRDAGLGALGGLWVAILHRALIGSNIDPRAEYWTTTIAGMAAGVALGRALGRMRPRARFPLDGSGRAGSADSPASRRESERATVPARTATTGTPPGGADTAVAGTSAALPAETAAGAPGRQALGYRRLAAVGLLAPIAFAAAWWLERGAPQLLGRMSDYFRNQMGDPRMVLYSIMLIALMLTRPTGLFGTAEIRTWWRERRAAKETHP